MPTNEEIRAINITTQIEAFRPGDVILVDGPSVTAKMKSSDFVKEVTAASYGVEIGTTLSGRLIRDNVEVGEVVDLTPEPNGPWQCRVIDCTAGDVFVVMGNGGENALLWAFVDSENKLISKSEQDLIAQNYIKIVAPANSNKLIVNDFNTDYFSVEKSDPSLWVSSRDDVTQKINSSYKDVSIVASVEVGETLTNNRISDNVEIGEVVNLTPIGGSGWQCRIIDCAKGDVFAVTGHGGSNTLLWAFVDGENKLVSKSEQNLIVTKYIVLSATTAGKLIVNDSMSPYFSVAKRDSTGRQKQDEQVRKNVEQNSDDISRLSAVEIGETLASSRIQDNVGVGEVVNLTPTSGGGWQCRVIDCAEGYIFYVRGKGGSNPLLWAFIDSENKLVSKSAQSVDAQNYIKIVAPANSSKLIVNDSNTSYFSVEKSDSATKQGQEKTIQDAANKVPSLVSDNAIHSNDLLYLSAFEIGETIANSRIRDNVEVGEVVDLTPTVGNGWQCRVIDCSEGDIFLIRGHGGTNPLLWAFVDDSDKLISKSAESAIMYEHIKIVAPANSIKLIVNDSNTDYFSVAKSDSFEKFEVEKNVAPDIKILTGVIPMVIFDRDLSLRDVSAEVARLDYSTGTMQKTCLEQVYGFFDELVSAYPDYVSKEDAAEVCGLEYPEYANGVETAGTYLVTPAYKTYCYKLIDTNVGAGNTTYCQKKKLLIFAGVHGNEYAAPFNTYLFAKGLCETKTQNYFALRALYDVYIIPCINGYGEYHMTRENANGVDLNRNYPIALWSESGQGTENWTGPSAGSEFETQIVMAYVNRLKPDAMVDHHNYGPSDRQFYMLVNTPDAAKLAYHHLIDVSRAYISQLPEYFGTNYQLFLSATSQAPQRLAPNTRGNSVRWGYENGYVSFNCEIGAKILYWGGELVNTNQQYTDDSFSVGEYMLRGFLVKLAETLQDENKERLLKKES